MLFWKGIFLQNMVNMNWKQLDWFHDFVMIFIVFILFLVGGFLMFSVFSNWVFKEFMENSILETLWTFFPIFILLIIGFYSMLILYTHEMEEKCFLSIKVTGHQWYWSYDYTDFNNIEFDSYMTPLSDLKKGEFRLLEVDNNIILPFNIYSRFIINSADVLHSWTIPSMGVKVDANPGRLNMISFNSNVSGLFYGQCSEICGANHSFMPICLEINTMSNFKNWILNF